ncbi:MAG: GNAT family N-acetyltransferase [Eubacterium sp.]|nr:GNAT family N-acetyltransferase [Eubacterium sp.]
MIRFTDDTEQIIELWRNVFKEDSREDVLFFLNESHHAKCLGYFEKDKLVSMLFLVDCSYSALNGKYVYAVCTNEKCRNKGYSSSLINESKKYMNDFLWLIPAHDSLFDFYAKFGFVTKLHSDKEYENKIHFDENNEIIEYLYSGSDYTYPDGMVYTNQDFPVGSTGLK